MDRAVTYTTYGLASLHEFLGDFVVYRNLVPADPRLPSFPALRERLGLGEAPLPRKAEPEYGRVVTEILCRARELDLPGVEIERLVYIGDTQMNDGTAFDNLCAAGGWPGRAFIGRDEMHHTAQVEVKGRLCLSNRWSALPDFVWSLEGRGFALDEGTALVVDVDKTAIGARGRNDGVIDQARVEGVRCTVADLLGANFDERAFRVAYDELNQPAYHTFTADNQDYLAYVCLILGAGLFELEALVEEVRAGKMERFVDFIARVEGRRAELAQTGLTPIHDGVYRCVRAGDPTPFKPFRYNEYLTTVARFGDLPGAPAEDVLARRIAITQEVREVAFALRERGVLIFGISDKPDEASLPGEEQAQAGMKPLHHLETLAVGETFENAAPI
ncbi:MAG: hypothetical protein ACE5OS_08045 [Anaerolineae bacterium]